MNTRALTLAAVLAGVSLGACTSENESIGVAFSTICVPTDDCTFAPECDAQYIGEIVFDRATARQLWLPVQMNNALINNADETVGRVNTNDAHVTSMEITYAGFALTSAVVGMNFTIPAAGSSTVVVDLVPFQPALLATGPAPGAFSQAVAQVVAKGYFENGATFETGKYPVAFTFCNGCMASAYTCPGTEVFELACGSVGAAPFAGACVAPPAP